ncbi:hypothetical protein QQ045_029545 [Rhodiola kirilowii]
MVMVRRRLDPRRLRSADGGVSRWSRFGVMIPEAQGVSQLHRRGSRWLFLSFMDVRFGYVSLCWLVLSFSLLLVGGDFPPFVEVLSSVDVFSLPCGGDFVKALCLRRCVLRDLDGLPLWLSFIWS